MRQQIVLGTLLLLTVAAPALTSAQNSGENSVENSAQNAVEKQNPVEAPESTAPAPLAERTLLDGRITLLIPEDFTVMTEEMLKFKYPAERRPTLVLTNARGTVNVAVNHTDNPLQPSEIPELLEVMEGMFQNLYPSATWHRREVVTIEDRQFMVLDLVTPAVDTEIRNMIVGTSVDGRLLMATFNCTKEFEGEWVEVGTRIIESIVVNEI